MKIFDKKVMYGILIGGMLFGTIGVAATAYLYSSDQVSYTKYNAEETDVKGALDELYQLSSHNLNRVLLGSAISINNASFDVSSIKGFEKLTADNFAIVPSSGLGSYGTNPAYSQPMTISYNNVSGIVTFSASCGSYSGALLGYSYNAYVYILSN